jgi:hypothetical protein
MKFDLLAARWFSIGMTNRISAFNNCARGYVTKQGSLLLIIAFGHFLGLAWLPSKFMVTAQTESQSFTKRTLPVCPCLPGRIVRVTDDAVGLWVSDGKQWFPLTSEPDLRWFGAKADDDIDDSAALVAALAVARTVKITAGTYRLSSDVTIPAGMSLKVESGGVISVDPGKTLTVGGPFEAGMYQVFAGSGRVLFSGLSNGNTPSVLELLPQWWGAKANAKADDLSPLTKTLGAAAACYCSVRLAGNYRVSGPIGLPNGVTLRGDSGNSQNWAKITANGKLGFSGNSLLTSDPGSGNQYSTLENISFEVLNIVNPRFEAVSIAGWSETANVRNLSFNLTDSTISRVLSFNNFGPVEFDNINLYYSFGHTLVNNEPMYVRAVNGLIVRNLNYTAVSPKSPYFEGGLFVLLEGLQIESHPTVASEPNITMSSLHGLTLRDSRLGTPLMNSTGVRIESTNLPDVGSYLLEQISLVPTLSSSGSWDKYVVIRDRKGTERSWDASRLVTQSAGQRPRMIERFTRDEQIFGGVESNNTPRVFRDLFLFKDVPNNGTIVVPFNVRVRLGTYGTGNVLILVNARSSVTNNGAMIWLTYADLPDTIGGVKPVFNYVVGDATSNWAAAYSNDAIVLTNKAGSAMNEITVTIIHSTFNTWPVG